jgi:hypothetical protein
MGAGTTSFHFKRLFRPRSMLRRPSEMTASRSRKTLYSSPKPFSKSRFVPGISAGLKSRVFQKARAKSKGGGLSQSPPVFLCRATRSIPRSRRLAFVADSVKPVREPTSSALFQNERAIDRRRPARKAASANACSSAATTNRYGAAAPATTPACGAYSLINPKLAGANA